MASSNQLLFIVYDMQHGAYLEERQRKNTKKGKDVSMMLEVSHAYP